MQRKNKTTKKKRRPDKVTVTTKTEEKSKVFKTSLDLVLFYKQHIDFFLYPLLYPSECKQKIERNPDWKALSKRFYDYFVQQAHENRSSNDLPIGGELRETVPAIIYNDTYAEKYLLKSLDQLKTDYGLALKYLLAALEDDKLFIEFFNKNQIIFNFFNDNYDAITKLAIQLKEETKIREPELIKIQEATKEHSRVKIANKAFSDMLAQGNETLLIPAISHVTTNTPKAKTKKSVTHINSKDLATKYGKYLDCVSKKMEEREVILHTILCNYSIWVLVDNFVDWLKNNADASSFLRKPVTDFLVATLKACLNEDTSVETIAQKFEQFKIKKEVLTQMYPGDFSKQVEITEAIDELKSQKTPVYR